MSTGATAAGELRGERQKERGSIEHRLSLLQLALPSGLLGIQFLRQRGSPDFKFGWTFSISPMRFPMLRTMKPMLIVQSILFVARKSWVDR